MPPVLLSGQELSARLDVTYATVLAWARSGKIPSIRTGQRKLYFSLDAVVRALRSRDEVDPEGGNHPESAVAEGVA